MEFCFQPNLFERGHISVQAGPISIWIGCLAATNCKSVMTFLRIVIPLYPFV
jgi:hypothetical protein